MIKLYKLLFEQQSAPWQPYTIDANGEEIPTKTGPFSLEILQNIANESHILKYIRQTLKKPISNGEYRSVWAIDNNTILKLAPKTREQNKTEVANAKCLGEKFAIKIMAAHSQYLWVIEERVQTLNEEQFMQKFNQLTGMNYTSPMQIILLFSNIRSTNSQSIIKGQQAVQQPTNNPWFRELADKLKQCNINSNDFHASNWGIRPSTGDLVILDLGF